MTAMAVSERDRAYMRRLAAYKQAAHAEASLRHRALPLAVRLERSWQLFVAGRASARTVERDDDPTCFYAAARARGLYRP